METEQRLTALLKKKNLEIMRLRKEKAALKNLAMRDPLTGLFNSRVLDMEATFIMARAKRAKSYVCVLCTDIDKFKLINDVFGHKQGDTVLKESAKVISKFFKRKDDIVSRKSEGSDEFICVWIADDLEATKKLVREIQKEISAIPVEDKSTMTFSVSAGFAYDRPDGNTLEGIIERADHNMYKRKKGTRKKR